jgi:hypothetical protein
MSRTASICLAIALAFASLSWQCRGAGEGVALQQALGSPDPLYKFSPDALAAAVRLCASNDAAHAGTYVALVLDSGRVDADAIAPSLVRAAIQGLGPNPKPDLVAAIVRAAVKATPTEVLDIVTAAVKASPRSAAPAIVTAAVSTVPHPEDMVTVNVQRRAERAATTDKQLDYKALPPAQKQLTLAEAIVQAALDADPTLSADELTTAVDTGIASTFEPGGPPVIITVLAPDVPILPDPPPVFNAPGPVSP